MTTKLYESKINAPVEKLWEFHRSAEALRLLSPPGKTVLPIGDDLEVRNGARHHLQIQVGPMKLNWIALLSEVEPPFGFTDTAIKSPFKFWRHRHEFIADGEHSILRDHVDYALPFGIFGELANKLFVGKDIDAMFAHRHKVTMREVEKLGTS
ncbi:MAG: SRPBCC family protein [Fimbriimonas sp.]